MAKFSEHIRNAGEHVKSAYGAGKEHINQHRRDYEGVHGNLPSAKEYVTSDAGRATARMAGGVAINKFLERGMRSGRSGLLKTALFAFAHTAFQGTMSRLKNDQRIFENIAKVKRGDPEIAHMSHTHLREVWHHANKYGGSHADHIRQATKGELDRRQAQKNREHVEGHVARHTAIQEALSKNRAELKAIEEARKEKDRQDRIAAKAKIHEVADKRREEAHKKKIQRLREVHSVVQASQAQRAAAKIAAQERLNQAKQEGEKSKTKETQARQKTIRQTLKERGKLQILKMNASGSAVVKTKAGGTRTASKEEVQASRKSKPSKSGAGSVKVVAHSRGRRRG